MARRAAGRAPLPHRALAFVVVLGLSTGLAVLSAHQAQFDAGSGIAIVGLIVLGGVLWFVAWWRGAWRLRGGNSALAMTFAGLIAVGVAGAHAVSEVVLTTRGESVEVVVVAQTDPDSDGYRLYTMVPTSGADVLRGDLHTQQRFDDGQVVTVLADRDGFVRPMLPDDLNRPAFTLIFLAGIGFLAASVIGFGFPLGSGRRAN